VNLRPQEQCFRNLYFFKSPCLNLPSCRLRYSGLSESIIKHTSSPRTVTSSIARVTRRLVRPAPQTHTQTHSHISCEEAETLRISVEHNLKIVAELVLPRPTSPQHSERNRRLHATPVSLCSMLYNASLRPNRDDAMTWHAIGLLILAFFLRIL
jgi:hypothetical protein